MPCDRGRRDAQHGDDRHLHGRERDRVQPVRVRALVHDPDGEQHRARERPELALPEAEVGAGQQEQTDGRDRDPGDDPRRRARGGCTAASTNGVMHDVQAGDERRRRRRRVLEPDRLRRVAAEEQHAGDDPDPHEQAAVLAVRRARSTIANGASASTAIAEPQQRGTRTA